ncbi:MAG: hypothetical protein ACRD1C_11410 [Terriglobales bacterium]
MRFAIACILLAAGTAAQTAVRPHSRTHAPAHYHGAGSATMSAPTVSNDTESGFTLSWSSNEPLNTQLHYGAGNLSQTFDDWRLTTQHTVTLTGLTAGTSYSVQAESSYYNQVDLRAATQSVTTAGAPPPPPPPPPPDTSSRLFPNAAWLYAAPSGTGLDISSMTAAMGLALNTHDGGFDYPVTYTDGTHGCTTFNDSAHGFHDQYCVPNPADGYWPAVGGWGANDGHLVVVDMATGTYYDFWKLTVTSTGQPTSTSVGRIASGSLSGNGTPGTTASLITGLAGDILPGELDCDNCLNHALNMVVPGGMNSTQVGHQGPALQTDGTVPGAIFREGAKLRMDPSMAISTLPVSTAVRAIMRALQLYGGVITDQTGSTHLLIYTALATAPDLTGLSLIGQHLLIYY